MRALIQRVNRACVTVDGEVVGRIGPGLCVFVGVTHSDDDAVAAKLAERVWRLRVFDDAGHFVWEDEPDGTCSALVDFLSRLA